MAEMRKKSETTVLILLFQVLREKEPEDTTRDHARAEEVGNGLPDHKESEETEHDEEEEDEGEHCAFLSEFGVSKVRKRDEDSFSADLFFLFDNLGTGLLFAEDVADIEVLCYAGLV